MKKMLLVILLSLMTLSNVSLASTLEIVVPNPPGGAVDLVGRTIQAEFLKQGINSVVINKPGANGEIAVRYTIESPNNRVMVTTTGSGLFLKLAKPDISPDPINDFVTLGPISTTVTAVVVNKNSTINSLDTLIAKAKTPHGISCGTTNSMAIYFGNVLAKSRNLNITIINFSGSAGATTALMGGHIDCTFDAITPYINKPMFEVVALSLPDDTGNFTAPQLKISDYQFQNYMALAFSPLMEVSMQQTVRNVISQLLKNNQARNTLKSSGLMLKPDLDKSFTQNLNSDFDILKNIKISN